LLGSGSTKQGLRYVSQHPVVKGWDNFSGDAASRSAERIEGQWIRCYLRATADEPRRNRFFFTSSPATEDPMTDEMKLAHMDIYAEGPLYKPSQTKKRSLGAAIFLVAIEDYRSTDEQEHKTAERFLYPQTRRWQEHYDWALALADELNPAWLRDALDRFKDEWDGQRAQRTARETGGHGRGAQMEPG
jgi:hypothetical protein